MRAPPMGGLGACRKLTARLGGLVAVAMALLACEGALGSPSLSVGEVITLSPSPSASETRLRSPGVPSGFPFMPGLQPAEPLSREPGLIGRWTTAANGAEVFAFLQDALPKAGFRIDLTAPGDSVAVLRFTPPGGHQLQIDLAQDGPGTSMELRLPRD